MSEKISTLYSDENETTSYNESEPENVLNLGEKISDNDDFSFYEFNGSEIGVAEKPNLSVEEKQRVKDISAILKEEIKDEMEGKNENEDFISKLEETCDEHTLEVLLKGTFNLVNEVIERSNKGDPLDKMIFLDRSGRNAFYMFDQMWRGLKADGSIPENIDRPDVRFLNIGRQDDAKHSNETALGLLKSSVKEGSYNTSDNVMIVDEFIQTGGSTKRAIETVEKVFGVKADACSQFSEKPPWWQPVIHSFNLKGVEEGFGMKFDSEKYFKWEETIDKFSDPTTLSFFYGIVSAEAIGIGFDKAAPITLEDWESLFKGVYEPEDHAEEFSRYYNNNKSQFENIDEDTFVQREIEYRSRVGGYIYRERSRYDKNDQRCEEISAMLKSSLTEEDLGNMYDISINRKETPSLSSTRTFDGIKERTNGLRKNSGNFYASAVKDKENVPYFTRYRKLLNNVVTKYMEGRGDELSLKPSLRQEIPA